MATLLKRSDAPLYRVFLGNDYDSFAQALAHEHCFTIRTILHAPGIAPDAQDQLASAIYALSAHKGNSWFEASLEQAVNVFLGVLPAETAVATPCVSSESAVAAVATPSASPETLAQESVGEEETADVAVEDSDDMETDDPDNPLWEYVQACSSREASKCVDVRAALEGKVGKEQARKLLARAKPTVAKDASGKKNRVLKLGGSLLQLK